MATAGAGVASGWADPDFAEFIIGPSEGRTRWLNPGYGLSSADAMELLAPRRQNAL